MRDRHTYTHTHKYTYKRKVDEEDAVFLSWRERKGDREEEISNIHDHSANFEKPDIYSIRDTVSILHKREHSDIRTEIQRSSIRIFVRSLERFHPWRLPRGEGYIQRYTTFAKFTKLSCFVSRRYLNIHRMEKSYGGRRSVNIDEYS